MSTTIFTAQNYDPEKARRKRQKIVIILSVAVILGGLFYLYRLWPYEHRVDQFLTAIENRDYKHAYALWQNDPQWEQHPAKYQKYPFSDFYRDWGPSGDWGIIKEHKIDGAATPKHGGTGVIVQVTVNQRVEPLRLWVERRDKTITWSPY
jgi:hypothetical protein